MKKKEGSKWAFLSLYYPENGWPFLLQQAVMPFLAGHERFFNKYILHFGKERGSYIGLSLEVPLEGYNYFIKQLDTHFRDFMRRYPAKPDVEAKTEKRAQKFMDFRPGALYHSLHYFLPLIGTGKEANLNYWFRSSNCILQLFGTDAFDMEDFFTAALYLDLILLIASGKNAIIYLGEIAGKLSAGGMNKEYIEKFELQLALFLDIRNDCINIANGVVSSGLTSIAAWANVFIDLLNRLPVNKPEYKVRMLKEVIQWTRAQLGIISDGTCFIDFCINWLLNTTSKVS